MEHRQQQPMQSGWRLGLVLALLLAMALVVVGRVLYLGLMKEDFLQGQGNARSLRDVSIPAHRGMILDRQGNPLAVSAPVVSIWADPGNMRASKVEWRRLAAALGRSPENLRAEIEAAEGREFVYLRRQLTPAAAEEVLAMGIDGVHGQKEYKRYYPAGEVATHLVGFTNIDGKGIEGLELAYDDWLSGTPGRKRVLRDRLGRTIKDIQALAPARPGRDLELSIDLRLQYLAYRELKAAVRQHGARSGSLVMLDARTGEVLALVSQPSYNPNDRDSLKPAHLRNRALTDTLEPGSTMKPLTVAAALASGRYRVSSEVDTTPGYLRISNATIRDHRDYGILDLGGIIKKSSNVGASKLALSLPENTLRNLFSNLGLGQATGTGFPGERVGELPYVPAQRRVEQAALAYGYGLAVTPLQLAQAYLPFATGGRRLPLSLLKQDQPAAGERILPRGVAQAVLGMMEAVTQPGGTGTRARVPGYRVAGKTGTTHKLGSSGYQSDQYMAVFAGVAPVSRPRLVTAVVIDEPSGQKYYGGEVAAPVFSRVMAGALRIMNLAPDRMPDGPRRQLAWN